MSADQVGTGEPWPVRNLALVLGVGATILTALRVLAVAHGDMATAETILSLQGWKILPQALLSAAPVMAVLPVIAFADVLREAIRHKRVKAHPYAVSGYALSLATALTIANSGWMGIPLSISVAYIITALFERRRSEKLSDRGVRFLAAGPAPAVTAIALILAVGFSFYSRPWLPLEEVELGNASAVGYVLGSSDGTIAVLDDKTRKVEFLTGQSIDARHLCGDGKTSRSLLAQILWRHAQTYPAC